VTNVAVGLLFFLHGAKLSREAIVAGATHWRLHLVVLLSTFALFPLLGLALKPLLSPLVTPALYAGVLFLCTLPSTVQSSIAFTSIAKGNVPAAVCSASASSLLGIFITPALVSVVVTNQAASGGASPWHTVGNIVLQLLVPFVAGQLLRPLIGKWIERNRGVLKFVDQGSILLVVYGAFSEAVNEGLWHQIPLSALGGLLVVSAVLLALALAVHDLRQQAARLQPRGPDHDHFLRFEEEPRRRRADGQGHFRLACGGRRRVAADAVPPDPVDGVRRARATLGRARHHGETRAASRERILPPPSHAAEYARNANRTFISALPERHLKKAASCGFFVISRPNAVAVASA
jgi:hypothetical protein